MQIIMFTVLLYFVLSEIVGYEDVKIINFQIILVWITFAIYKICEYKMYNTNLIIRTISMSLASFSVFFTVFANPNEDITMKLVLSLVAGSVIASLILSLVVLNLIAYMYRGVVEK